MLPGSSVQCVNFLHHRLACKIIMYKHAAMPHNVGKSHQCLLHLAGDILRTTAEHSAPVTASKLQMPASASGF